MKTITNIEMANDNDIYAISFGELLSVKPDGEGFYIFEGDEELNYFTSFEEANEAMKEIIVDDSLIVKGYGKHSGRKFWQLPEVLKNEILMMSQAQA